MAMLVYDAVCICRDQTGTLLQTLESLARQDPPPASLLLVDDGSADAPALARIASQAGARLIRHPKPLGRGAARARGLAETQAPWVLTCDSTNGLRPDFVLKASAWTEDSGVAAVFGRITQLPPRNAVQRWRGRHLFKEDAVHVPRRDALLSTYGTWMRRAAVEAVGGFNPELRQYEDADLGRRLLAAGHAVVYDPALPVTSLRDNTLGEVLERYWRWYCGPAGSLGFSGYLQALRYAVTGMARQDLAKGDPAAACISLLCPQVLAWYSWRRGT